MNETHLAFSGTRLGLTLAQAQAIDSILAARRPGYLHHGDCVGADAQVHAMARLRGWRIVAHPPTDTSRRAFCDPDLSMPAADYLSRNHALVDSAQELLAAPKGRQELRSGTWATVRYARRQRKLVTIIYHDGVLEFSP